MARRTARHRTQTALVLSGGGSRGAYQAGCWQALHEAGFQPDLIVGTSVGAINGAFIASGEPPEALRRWWTTLRQRDVVRARKDLWRALSWDALRDARPLLGLLRRGIDLAALRASPIDVIVTMANVTTGRELSVRKDTLTHEHLFASCALVPGLPPVELAGHVLADGGHWNAFPLRHAVEAGATRVHALLHDPLEPHPQAYGPSLRSGLLRRITDVAWHGDQAGHVELLRVRARLPRRDPMRVAPFGLHVHAPHPPLTNDILTFHPKLASNMYDRGLDETRRRLATMGP